jgi:molybdate transport system regulatory protein
MECGEGSAEVTVALGGGKRITAIVTRDSVQSMNLQPGSPTCALIKASHVIIAVGA